MKISVAIESLEEMIIPAELVEAQYLIFVDVDHSSIIETKTKSNQIESDVFFAQSTIEWDCEAIICGGIDEKAFEILANQGITRYLGTGYSSIEAIKLMKEYSLPLIKEYNGGTGCKGE